MEEKRERITFLGAAGLVYSAVIVDLTKAGFYAIGLIPAIGIFGPISAILVGFIASVIYFLVYQFFDVDFTERILARGLGYLLGAILPGGTTIATAITVYFILRDDRAYNEEKGL